MKVKFQEEKDYAHIELDLEQIINTETSSSDYDESVVETIRISKQLWRDKQTYFFTIFNKEEQYDFDDELSHGEFVNLIKELAKLAKIELKEDKGE